MADVKTEIDEIEEIGKTLQERKRPESEPVIESSPGRTEETDIDAELKQRVHEILSSGEWMNVDIDQIILPQQDGEHKELYAKFQFRRKRQNYDALKNSIRDIGVVAPIVLKRESGVDGVVRYYLLDGHTRTVILKELLQEDPTTLIPPFLVVDCNDADATLVADVLNSFGENLDGEDKAFAAIRMYEIGGLPQVEIARRLNYGKSTVSEIISAFRDVPKEAREMIETRKWSVRHGRELARLKDDKEEQMRIFENAKQHRYSSEKMEQTVYDSRSRRKYQSEAKKYFKEQLSSRKDKTLTTADFEALHKQALKAVCKEHHPWGGGETQYKMGNIVPAPTYTKAALEELDFEIVEGEVTIEKAEEKKPEKPKMPTNDELMQEGYHRSICPFCGGRTSQFIAEHLDFECEDVYHPHTGIAHTYCYLKNKIETLQKLFENTAIYKRLQKDPEGFSLEQMNNQSHAIYKEELERRKQQWRIENLPDPQATVKKGTKTGEVANKSKTPEDEGNPELIILQQIREKQPDLVEECFFEAYEKYLKRVKGYESQAKVKKSLKSSMGTVSRNFLKISAAIDNFSE